jgi:hypothetical protein
VLNKHSTNSWRVKRNVERDLRSGALRVNAEGETLH